MPEGTVLIPKILTLGPFISSLTANPTKAKVKIPTTAITDINNFAIALGTSEYLDSAITWEGSATNDTWYTFASVQGRYVWARLIGVNDTIDLSDRADTVSPIEIGVA